MVKKDNSSCVVQPSKHGTCSLICLHRDYFCGRNISVQWERLSSQFLISSMTGYSLIMPRPMRYAILDDRSVYNYVCVFVTVDME